MEEIFFEEHVSEILKSITTIKCTSCSIENKKNVRIKVK